MLILIFFVLNANCRQSFSLRNKYIQKPVLQGYGSLSKNTGKLKTKVTTGHYKKTSNGVRRVQSYARS